MSEQDYRTPHDVLESAILSKRHTVTRILTYERIGAIDLDRSIDTSTAVKVMEMPEGASAVCGRGTRHGQMALYTGRRYVVEILPITVGTHAAPDYLDQLVKETLAKVNELFMAMLGYLQEHRRPPDDPFNTSITVLIIGRKDPDSEKLLSRSIPLAATNGSLLSLGHPTVIRTATGWQMTSYIGVGVYATW